MELPEPVEQPLVVPLSHGNFMASYTPLATNQGQALGGALMRAFQVMQAAKENQMRQQQFGLQQGQLDLEKQRFASDKEFREAQTYPLRKQMALDSVRQNGLSTMAAAPSDDNFDDSKAGRITPAPATVPRGTTPDGGADASGVSSNTMTPPAEPVQPAPQQGPPEMQGPKLPALTPTQRLKMMTVPEEDTQAAQEKAAAVQAPPSNRMTSAFKAVKTAGRAIGSLLTQPTQTNKQATAATQPNKNTPSLGQPDVPSATPSVGAPTEAVNPIGNQPSALQQDQESGTPAGPTAPSIPQSQKMSDEPDWAAYDTAGKKFNVTLGENEVRMHHRMTQLLKHGLSGSGSPPAGTYLKSQTEEYNPATGWPVTKTEYAANAFGGTGGITPEVLTYANGINDATKGNPAWARAQDLVGVHNDVRALAKDATGASDQALAGRFIQSYAPTARFNPQNGEIVGQGAENVPGEWASKLKKIFTGEHLLPDTREKMVKTVETLARSASQVAKKQTESHYRLASQLGPAASQFINPVPEIQPEAAGSHKTGDSNTPGSTGGSQVQSTPQVFTSMDAFNAWKDSAPANARFVLKLPNKPIQTGYVP